MYLPKILILKYSKIPRSLLNTTTTLIYTQHTLYILSYFTTSTSFRNNKGTAVYVTAGSIGVLESTRVVFDSNEGYQRGAIALAGFSVLRTFPNSVLIFTNNHATDVGGAIYAAFSDSRDLPYSRSCFIQYTDNSVDPHHWQVHFFFANNTAGRYGKSIYATSLLPCSHSATSEYNMEKVFHWRPFHYLDPHQESNIASDPATLRLNISSHDILKFSPGESINLNPVANDDLNNSIDTVCKAAISHMHPSQSVAIHSSFIYLTGTGTIVINGQIGSVFQINVEIAGPISSDTDNHCSFLAITRYCSIGRFKPLLDSFQGCYKDRSKVLLSVC